MLCFIITVLVLPTFGCSLQHPAPEVQLLDPTGHLVDVHALPWSIDLAPNVNVVEIDPPSSMKREQLTRSGDATAYVVARSDPNDPQIEYVYFDRNSKTYRIEGVPLGHRPISDVVWASPRYLVFDRWSQPHYGVHYVVDTEQLCVVHICPFPDQFYLDQQSQVFNGSLEIEP